MGHHYLVDYDDSSKYPNFLGTIFGHGCYTKIKYMKFHLNYICEYFY